MPRTADAGRAHDATTTLTPLSDDRCVQALRGTRIGRIATTIGPDRRPLIRPVSYLYDTPTRSIIFHSLPGTKLHALLNRRDASFEIDGESDGGLWSVILRGRVETVDRPQEIARLASLHSSALAIPREGPWLRIRGEVITGMWFAPPGAPPAA